MALAGDIVARLGGRAVPVATIRLSPCRVVLVLHRQAGLEADRAALEADLEAGGYVLHTYVPVASAAQAEATVQELCGAVAVAAALVAILSRCWLHGPIFPSSLAS